MAKHAKKSRRGIASLLISALLFSGVVLEATVSERVEPAEATSCQFTIEAVHGPKSYFDNKQNRGYLGFYLGYRVTALSGVHSGLKLKITLANQTANKSEPAIFFHANQSDTEELGDLDSSATSSAVAYFLTKVGPDLNQSITAQILDSSSSPVAGCSITDVISQSSRDSLQANANKIYSASVSNANDTVGTGSRVVVTVTGNTGTLGSGPDSTQEINLVPVAVQSSFRPDVWKLEKVSFFSANPSCNSGQPIEDRLYLSNATPVTSVNCAGVYSANYVFKARDFSGTLAASSAQVQAFSYVASGNLIKHTTPFSTTIALPAFDDSSTFKPQASEPDLAVELSAADIPFTANDLLITTNRTLAVTSSELTFLSPGGGSVDWSTLEISLNGTSGWGTSPLTINENASTQTGGIFSIVSMGDGTKRIKFDPDSATVDTGDAVLPAEIFFRISDNDSPQVSTTGLISANVTSTTPHPPTVSTAAASVSPLANITLSPTIQGTGPYSFCIYASEPAASPCTNTAVSATSLSWSVNSQGVVSFSALAGFSGNTSVIFGATDGFSQLSTASVTVEVLAPATPTITAETENSVTAQLVTLSPTLTASSSFTICLVDGGNCASSLATSQGTWNVVGNEIEFTSVNTFTGNATATARIADLFGKTANATQTVVVSAPAMPSVADISGATTTTTPKSVTPIITSALPTVGCLEDSANLGSCDSGTVTQAGVGSWTASSGDVTFTADAAFTGTATISYLVTDTLGRTDSASVSILVNGAGAQLLDAITVDATSVTSTTATFNGSVDASGVTSNAYFCYDTQSNLSACTLIAATPVTVAGNGSASVSLAITGLTAGTEYFFKAASGDGVSTESGSVLSFSTQVVVNNTPGTPPAPAPAPAPAPIAPESTDPCEPEVALTSEDAELAPYFAETFQIMFSGIAGSVGYGIDSLANNQVSLALSSAKVLGSNPLTSGVGVVAGATEMFFEISFTTKAKNQKVLQPTDVVISSGENLGEVELSTTDDQPLEILSVQSIDLELYVDYSGAELNNPLLWQQMGYGMLCWKLEPFTETSFVLPNPIQLPAGTPEGNWVYSNVIVKAGSASTDPTTFQANTLFPKPGPGQAVWADVNGNGIYDPGGKGGDKAISHVKICADLLTETPAPTPTPTQTAEGAETPAPAPSPTQTQTPSPTPTPTQTATPAPTATTPVPATPAPALTPTPSAAPTPTTTTACATPIPTNTADQPKISNPTPLPTITPRATIRVVPLSIPTPSPSDPETPAPEPTEPGVTPTPTPSESAAPSPETTEPGEVTPSPTPTTPGSEVAPTPTPTNPVTPAPTPTLPGGTPLPTIDLSAPTLCEPNAAYGVAMKVSNGLSTTCVRITASYFNLLAFAPREFIESEETFTTQEGASEEEADEVLADTGAETTDLLLWALMLFGAGLVLSFLARRRA